MPRGIAKDYPPGFFDLDILVIRDKANVPIRYLTLENIAKCLEAILYQEKTGVTVMVEATENRVIISFNSLAKVLGLDPSSKLDWKAADKKKVLDEIHERFDAWINMGTGPFSSANKVLDKDFEARAPKILHGIFNQLGGQDHKLKLEAVVGIFAMQSKEDDDLDEIKTQLKLLVQSEKGSKMWFISGGPAPDMIRLLTQNGKSAGTRPTPKAASSSSAEVIRFGDKMKALGFTSEKEFYQAKKDLGKERKDSVSIADLQKWLKEQK